MQRDETLLKLCKAKQNFETNLKKAVQEVTPNGEIEKTLKAAENFTTTQNVQEKLEFDDLPVEEFKNCVEQANNLMINIPAVIAKLERARDVLKDESSTTCVDKENMNPEIRKWEILESISK